MFGKKQKEKTNSSGTNNKKKRAKKTLKVPKTVQQTIPYYAVYPEEELIETSPGRFTRAYELQDINYQIAKPQEQEEMFIKYGEFLNSFDTTVDIQIVINNKSINREFFEAETLLKYKDDQLDELREEMNTMLKKKIREGQNNLIKEKYLIIGMEAKSVDEAVSLFNRLDSDITSNVKKIGSSNARPLSVVERLSQLHDIYNPQNIGKFGNKVCDDVKRIDGFDFVHMRKLGLTTKDCIAPPLFKFHSNYGMIGETYFESLYLDNLPTSLADNVLAELTNSEFKMLTSLNIYPVPMEKAQKIVKTQIVNINANVIDRQKKASSSMIDPNLVVSPELREAQEEANELLRSLSSQNQKMFRICLVVTHFADSREELKSNSDTIKSTARRLLCSMQPLLGQQENGLNASLPLCNSKIEIKRTLTTDSTAVFMPFVNQELNDRNGGLYYGNNAVSRNLIMFNRRNSKNGNGFILGTPGSGKSMSAKEEMLNVLLSSDDEVIVIDPEGEYYPMAELLGGEVIRIAPGSDVHINPLDMDQNYAGNEDDPVTLKSDFLISIFDIILGGRYDLTPGQRSIIDRCTRNVYKRYMESFDNTTGKFNEDLIPTLRDFYKELNKQSGYDAQELAKGLEIYAEGSLSLFAHKTNVSSNNRFIVFDIKDVGSSIKTLALLVVLDNVWNRIVAGRAKGKHVWFYIDEIYLLFKSEQSAEFLRTLYKRARKYGGIPTGITQNVADLLENDIARTMISNCEFIQMLNQAPLDRKDLAMLLNISPTQLSFITNAGPGEGLIYTGTSIIPFKNQLPKDTKMYEAMTTKLEEVKDIQRRKQKANV